MDPEQDPDRGIFKRILTKSFGEVGRGPRNNQLDFGDDLGNDSDTEFFKIKIIYYRDSRGQPRINHDILGGGLTSTE